MRDGKLGRTPKDIDIVTNASPDQVESLFAKTIAIGKQFGIIVVVIENKKFDVASFRSDGAYVDGRHPTSVHYSTPQEDAQRRDFTINAMFYDPLSKEIFDFVGGEQDLEKKVLRTVGIASDRFAEDKLRILRAIRFVSELGFQLEADTYEAISKLANRISQVSVERQWVELKKLLVGQYRSQSWRFLEETGLFRVLMPELLTTTDQSEARCRYVEKLSPKIGVTGFLAGLFFVNDRSAFVKTGEAGARIQKLEFCMRRFKASGEELEITKQILVGLEMISAHQREAYLKKLSAKPFAHQMIELAQSLMMLGYVFPGLRTMVQNVDIELAKPLIDASSLMTRGFKPGPRMGRVLEECYNLQLENPKLNTEELIQKASKSTDNQ